MARMRQVVRKTVDGKKYIVDEEIDKTTFLGLQIKTDVARVKKVDYEKLVDKLHDKYLTVSRIGQLMIECSSGLKKKVYYSEVLGAIKRLESQGLIQVERRLGQRVYYHITKKIQES